MFLNIFLVASASLLLQTFEGSQTLNSHLRSLDLRIQKLALIFHRCFEVFPLCRGHALPLNDSLDLLFDLPVGILKHVCLSAETIHVVQQ